MKYFAFEEALIPRLLKPLDIFMVQRVKSTSVFILEEVEGQSGYGIPNLVER